MRNVALLDSVSMWTSPCEHVSAYMCVCVCVCLPAPQYQILLSQLSASRSSVVIRLSTSQPSTSPCVLFFFPLQECFICIPLLLLLYLSSSLLPCVLPCTISPFLVSLSALSSPPSELFHPHLSLALLSICVTHSTCFHPLTLFLFINTFTVLNPGFRDRMYRAQYFYYSVQVLCSTLFCCSVTWFASAIFASGTYFSAV